MKSSTIMKLTFALLLTASFGFEKPNSRRAGGCCSRRSKDQRGSLIERTIKHPAIRPLTILALLLSPDIGLAGMARAEDQPLAMTTTTSTTTTPAPVDRYLDPAAGIGYYWSDDFTQNYGWPAREICEEMHGNIHDIRECMNERLALPLKCINRATDEWRALGDRAAPEHKHELRLWIQDQTERCVYLVFTGRDMDSVPDEVKAFVKPGAIVEVVDDFTYVDEHAVQEFVPGDKLRIMSIDRDNDAVCKNEAGATRYINPMFWTNLRRIGEFDVDATTDEQLAIALENTQILTHGFTSPEEQWNERYSIFRIH